MSSLARHMPRPKTPEWQLHEFRRRAWMFDGIACLDVSKIPDDWERQVVTNVANRLFGERSK